METLRERTDADSITEVIRNALAVYELLFKEKDAGGRIVIKNDKGEREVILVP